MLMPQTLNRKRIWSGWLRVSHALVGLSTLVLLATGYLIQHSPVLGHDATDWHHIASGGVFVGLAIRVYLFMFGQPHERFNALIPQPQDGVNIWHTLRFYLLMGKAPLPRWYAHNPLWKPLYLLLYLMLFIQLGSGFLMPDQATLWGFYLPSLHAFWAEGIFWFAVLHLITSIWHDYAGAHDDVSAMIHGQRLFTLDPTQTPSGNESSQGVISVDALRQTAKKKPSESE